MITATEDTTMSHHLNAAQQNAILATCEWTREGRVKVVATHRTEGLLKLAGVSSPRPMECYEVPVRRLEKGFLVVDEAGGVPQAVGAGELFEKGGIFSGEKAVSAGDEGEEKEIPAGFFEEVLDAVRIRRFEVATGERTRVRVEVLAYDDGAEGWVSREASDAEIHGAMAALRMAREIDNYER